MVAKPISAKLYVQQGDKWVQQSGVFKVSVGAGLLVAADSQTGKMVVEHTLDPKNFYRIEEEGTLQIVENNVAMVLAFKDEISAENVANRAQVELAARFTVGYACLGSIAEYMEECVGCLKLREAIAKRIKQAEVQKLAEIRDALEDTGDTEGLVVISKIVALMFCLVSPELVFMLLSERFLPKVIAMLEHHPRRPRAPHRAMLHSIVFRNPLGLPDELANLLKHINTMAYFRDVCLPVDLDDVSSEIVSKQVELTKNNAIQWIVREDDRVSSIVASIHPDNPAHEDVVRFVSEMFIESKTLPMEFRDSLLTKFCHFGLIGSLSVLIDSERTAPTTLQEVSTIFFTISNFNANLLRSEILSTPSILTSIFTQMLREPEEGFRSQWQDTSLVLIDASIMKGLGKVRGDIGVVQGLTEEFFSVVCAEFDCLSRVLSCHPLVHPETNVMKADDARLWSPCDVPSADSALTTAAPIIAYFIGECEEGANWSEKHRVLQLTHTLLSHPTTSVSTRLFPCLRILKGSLTYPTAPDTLASLDPFPSLLPYLRREGLASASVLSFIQAVIETLAKPLVDLVLKKYIGKIGNKALVEEFRRAEETLDDSDTNGSPFLGL
eukprot:TRINITY_DN12681_c0_g1_i1.p1 TRINITY_DN12681_c0_g1~~TRINITY_DN12681_c0_g1_i1.p1  ORF type:complete len:610 (+),score=102.72 TRINITY_DN12681_c0_g1_i1:45-1874(+)